MDDLLRCVTDAYHLVALHLMLAAFVFVTEGPRCNIDKKMTQQVHRQHLHTGYILTQKRLKHYALQRLRFISGAIWPRKKLLSQRPDTIIVI